MADWPVMLRVAGRKVVVVGGGPVARRRCATLRECGADVTVIAPAVDHEIEKMEAIKIVRRAYRTGDLAGAFLGVTATDDKAVNEAVQREANAAGVLVNRADDPESGDFSVMAHKHRGPITVGVSTSGISAKAAAAIRDAMLEGMDRDWIKLLEVVGGYRDELQAKVADVATRQAALMRLTDQDAMRVLKSGGAGALQAHVESIVKEAVQP